MAESKAEIVIECYTPTEVKVERNPILFLHAMLCSKEIWTTIPQSVADGTGRKVYTYDARNHGASAFTTEEFNFKTNVDDLFLVMQLIKDQYKDKPNQFVLVGHDMGGMTAIGAALREPGNFEKVIVVEMYAKNVEENVIDRTKVFVKEWTKCVQDLPKSTPLEKVTNLSVEELYKRLEYKEETEKKSYLNGKFRYKETANGYDAYYNSAALVNALDELKKELKEETKKETKKYEGSYEGPAYFFYGTESHYKIQNETKSMMEHFPKAVLVPFEGGSHFFVADKPVPLANELVKRINETSSLN